jgi:hypothetical protein
VERSNASKIGVVTAAHAAVKSLASYAVLILSLEKIVSGWLRPMKRIAFLTTSKPQSFDA